MGAPGGLVFEHHQPLESLQMVGHGAWIVGAKALRITTAPAAARQARSSPMQTNAEKVGTWMQEKTSPRHGQRGDRCGVDSGWVAASSR
jgi:hypothetical protein